MPPGVRKDTKNPLTAQRTVFGWVVTEKIHRSNSLPFKFKSPTDLSHKYKYILYIYKYIIYIIYMIFGLVCICDILSPWSSK